MFDKYIRSKLLGYTALFSARSLGGANLQKRHRKPIVPEYRSRRLLLRLSSTTPDDLLSNVVVVIVLLVPTTNPSQMSRRTILCTALTCSSSLLVCRMNVNGSLATCVPTGCGLGDCGCDCCCCCCCCCWCRFFALYLSGPGE